MRLPLRSVREYAAKFFFFILYAEDSFEWIRRHDFRFSIERRPLERQFDMKMADLTKIFKCLQNLGWVYNYRYDKFTHRFSVRVPMWLDISEIGKMTNRYVQFDPHYGEMNTHVDWWYIRNMAKAYEENQKKLSEMVSAEETKARTPEEILGK